jgi:general secretion pathway protein F
MVVFVFPKIVPLFENANVELPFTTRMLIWLSDFLTQFGIFAAVGAVIIWILFRVLLHVRPIKYFYDSTLFYAPIFGKAVVNFNMANFTRTLGLLLKSGVPITEAIDITAETLTNSVYRRRLKTASDQVRKGEFLSRYLYKKSREFPTTLVNMLEVGENTGNLTENLKYLDEYYDNEVDAFTKNLSSILEPLLLLVMGGVVAFIALSFITPIYQVTRTIQ